MRDLAHAAGSADPDLPGEHRTETVYPCPDVFMANVDSTLVQQVLNITERQRKPDVHHDRELDNLGRCLEVAEWILGHAATLPPSTYPCNLPVLLTMPSERLYRSEIETTLHQLYHLNQEINLKVSRR